MRYDADYWELKIDKNIVIGKRSHIPEIFCDDFLNGNKERLSDIDDIVRSIEEYDDPDGIPEGLSICVTSLSEFMSVNKCKKFLLIDNML